MKVIVQIPCLNEEQSLFETIEGIPRRIDGVDTVEVLVIDDGSTDGSVNLALDAGADHLVRHTTNRGLAAAFRSGLDSCLRLGADIIVNTDADNQYCAQDIPNLIGPILTGNADIVVGDRNTRSLPNFSFIKKTLQAVGTFVVRRVSQTEVRDAVSGFRAFSRDAAMRLNIVSSYSHTIETLIQAGKQGMRVASVPVRTNETNRQSRLFRSTPRFIAHSIGTMLRTYTMYQPLKVFLSISLLLMVVGLLPILRFLYFYFSIDGEGHIQSLVLGGTLVLMGFLTLMIGLVSDVISMNRRLMEMALERIRRIELRQIEQQTPIDANGFVHEGDWDDNVVATR